MQKAYISALYELMQKDARVCSLLSDSGTEYDEMMAREFSNQCFNFGIAEQNKVAAASGMAALGKIPFVYTTGAFLAYRSYEFIRDDICFQRRNVKIVGMGSSTAWNTLGASHHTTEDISALRALPNLVLLSPASPIEARKCVLAAYESEGPV
jgi:transketolase